jgi:hypothetical protein
MTPGGDMTPQRVESNLSDRELELHYSNEHSDQESAAEVEDMANSSPPPAGVPDATNTVDSPQSLMPDSPSVSPSIAPVQIPDPLIAATSDDDFVHLEYPETERGEDAGQILAVPIL